ncbi:MAG: hypothetical protein ACREM3_10075 [Candidatus Rokuibacteriota bacterium]
MRRLLAPILVAVLLLGLAVPAQAGGAATAALALASFAVFNQLVFALSYPPPVYAAPVYGYGAPAVYPYARYPAYGTYPASPVYGPPYASAARPAPVAPPAPAVVHYPHGRYELRGDGITAAYQWVWIWNAPSASPALAAEPTRSPSPATR